MTTSLYSIKRGSRFGYTISFSRLPAVDHILWFRSRTFLRRPSFPIPISSIQSSNKFRVCRLNLESSSRDRKVALSCPSPLTVSRLCLPRIGALADPRACRAIESGVQYYSNSLSDGSGFKKRIHGGGGDDEAKPGGGYGRGCAAFLEFHEVSQVCMTRTNTSLKPHQSSHTPHSCTPISRPRVTTRC